MNPVRLYDYLSRARARLFDWIRPLRQEQYTQEFPFGLRTLRATMIEIALSEWYYGLRLRGDEPPPKEECPISEARQATFRDLEAVWADLASGTRALLAEIIDWDTPLKWRTFQSGRPIIVLASRGDIAAQLCFHEVHHRAQAMAMLRQLGIAAQDLDYSFFMFQYNRDSIQ